MPHYDYRCTACGHEFELFQSMTAPIQRKCPACGKAKLERLIGTGAGVIFKGGGFYETDYRSEEYRKAAEAEGKGPGGAEAGSAAAGQAEAGKEAGKEAGADSAAKKVIAAGAAKDAAPGKEPAAAPKTSAEIKSDAKSPAKPKPTDGASAKKGPSRGSTAAAPVLGLPSPGAPSGWPGTGFDAVKSGKGAGKHAPLNLKQGGKPGGKPISSRRSNTGRSSRGGR